MTFPVKFGNTALVKAGDLWYIGYTMEKEGDIMGTMKSRRRKSGVRFLLMALRDAGDEPDPDKKKNKLDIYKKTLED